MKVAELIATCNLGFTCERAREDEDIWKCRITCEDRGMNVYHLSAGEPTLAAVLERLVAAARQHVNSKVRGDPKKKLTCKQDLESFHRWCSIYGYDPESTRDHVRYVRIRRKAEQFKYIIGISAYRRLVQ